MFILEDIIKAIIQGDSETCFRLTQEAIEKRIPVNEILDKALIPGLRKVGDLFENGSFYMPELILAGEAVGKTLELLRPHMERQGVPFTGRYLIGTVKGDIHDLGKNIVIMMLKGNGWEVTDLGVDVSPEEFCTAVEKGNYHILGLSSLLTMTMPYAAKTIEALKKAGLREKVKIMVGGAPTTPAWAASIGANAHAKDAPMAVKVAASLIGKS